MLGQSVRLVCWVSLLGQCIRLCIHLVCSFSLVCYSVISVLVSYQCASQSSVVLVSVLDSVLDGVLVSLLDSVLVSVIAQCVSQCNSSVQ